MADSKKYEVLLMTDPNIDDAKLGIVLDKLNDVCEKNGAKIVKRTPWGRKRLAYEIKDQREANYTLLDLESQPSAIARVEAFLKIQNPVMRFLTTCKQEA